jgi:hypothetical protein
MRQSEIDDTSRRVIETAVVATFTPCSLLPTNNTLLKCYFRKMVFLMQFQEEVFICLCNFRIDWLMSFLIFGSFFFTLRPNNFFGRFIWKQII